MRSNGIWDIFIFKTGDKIYLKDHYDNFCAAIIESDPYDGEFQDYYKVSLTDGNHGTIGAKKDECFATMEECVKYHQAESDQKVQEYMRSISTPEDLVLFCLKNNVACAEEYTDWEARTAAINMAKQFGIIKNEDEL